MRKRNAARLAAEADRPDRGRSRIGGLWGLVAVSAVAALSRSGQAADRPVVDFVASDAGICIRADGLADQVERFHASEIAQRFVRSQLFRDWSDSKGFREMAAACAHIALVCDKPVREVFNDVFGDDVAIAVYPVDDGDPIAILLTRLRDRKTVETLVSQLLLHDGHDADRTDHRGFPIVRVKRGEKSVFVYAIVDGILALSDREDLVLAAIDRGVSGRESALGALSNSAEYNAAIGELNAGGITFYLNPRAWDHEFQVDTVDKPAEQFFGSVWLNCRAIVAGVALDPSVRAEMTVLINDDNLPDVWHRFARAIDGIPAYLDRIPRTAVAAVAGRHHPAGFNAFQQSVAGDSSDLRNGRNAMRGLLFGLDPIDDVLPVFARDWCAYVTPRNDTQAKSVPVQGLAAFMLVNQANGRRANNDQPDPRAALDNALRTGLNLAAAWFNGQKPEALAFVKSEQISGGTMQWVHNLRPVEAAYAITDSELIVATSPALIREFIAGESPPAGRLSDRYRRAAATGITNPNQVVMVQIDEVAAAVSDRRRSRAEGNAVSGKRDRELQRLLELLRLVDFGAAQVRIARDRVAVAIGVVADVDEAPAAE